MEPFAEELFSYGMEWAAGHRRVEVVPWTDGFGLDVRIEGGSVRSLSLDAEELYALADCIDKATAAGKLKPGHQEVVSLWKRVKSWFAPVRK